MRTCGWCMRIAFWVIDGLIHNMWIAWTHQPDREDSERHRASNDGRLQFQMDLAKAFIKSGINLDLDHDNDGDRPDWMRHPAANPRWCPCECRDCWLCEAGVTQGMCHPAGVAKTGRKKKARPCKMVKMVKRRGTCRACYQRISADIKAGRRTDAPPSSKARTAWTKAHKNLGTHKCANTDHGVFCGLCKDRHLDPDSCPT